MGPSGRGLGEGGRKAAHAGVVLAVPFFVCIPVPALLVLSALALAAVWALGPTLFARIARPGEGWPRFALAVSSFPLAAAILLASFPGRPAVAAAGIAVLAAGDSAACLAGRRLGRTRLPWNRAKSVAGTAAFFAAALPVSASAFAWVDGRSFPAGLAFLAGPVALGALAESLPSKLGDNLPAAVASGLLLGAIAEGGGAPAAAVAERLLPAALVVGLFAAVALAVRATDRRGAAAGFALGGTAYLSFGLRGFALLALFVGLGAAASRLRGGPGRARSARHAVANLAVPSFAALLHLFRTADVLEAAYAGALAAALADTLSGEIGMLSRTLPRLILGFRPVPPGTNGGVTMLGTVSGVAAALVLAGAGLGLGFLGGRWAAAVAFGGAAGTLFDSILGASAENAGLLGNEEVNFLATLFGALVACSPRFL